MRPVWLARLADPQPPRGPLLLAIQAAAVARLTDAIPHLHRLALDPGAQGDVRLEAARALAGLQPAGLEPDACRLADSAGLQDVLVRLVAATLLARHRGPAAEALLFRLADDPQPAVAAAAGGRLAGLNPARLKPLLNRLAASRDSGLRRLAARVLADLRTPEAVAQLGPLLDDPHRDLRVSVRESLVRLADVQALAGPVRQAAMRVLASAGPRGREQAALVVGAVRHEPAAERLLQLLGDNAQEVRVAAAWALRRLALPATAATILKWVQAETSKTRQLPPEEEAGPSLFGDLEQLIETLGVLRYRPAAPVLKKYLPPPPVPLPNPATAGANPVWQPDLRAAAFWSLGRIYAADPQPDLAAAFGERVGSDVETVRAMAAVGIGRMKARDLAPVLRRIYEDETASLPVRRACAWSLGQLTGKPVPPPEPPAKARETWYSGWFLEPLDR
jgi:HEAT repeat protein